MCAPWPWCCRWASWRAAATSRSATPRGPSRRASAAATAASAGASTRAATSCPAPWPPPARSTANRNVSQSRMSHSTVHSLDRCDITPTVANKAREMPRKKHPGALWSCFIQHCNQFISVFFFSVQRTNPVGAVWIAPASARRPANAPTYASSALRRTPTAAPRASATIRAPPRSAGPTRCARPGRSQAAREVSALPRLCVSMKTKFPYSVVTAINCWIDVS